jgi:hypothetical protein
VAVVAVIVDAVCDSVTVTIVATATPADGIGLGPITCQRMVIAALAGCAIKHGALQGRRRPLLLLLRLRRLRLRLPLLLLPPQAEDCSLHTRE